MASLVAVAGCGASPTAPAAPPEMSSLASSSCSSAIISGDPNVSSPARCVRFSGYEWIVKSSAQFGPGPNVWGDGPDNVWVDAQGMHLTIRNVGGVWMASEVILNGSLGYGTYMFHTRDRGEPLDPNAMVGLFTYNYADAAFAHREIDMEFSSPVGGALGARGQFAVQPYEVPGNTYGFDAAGSSAHSFNWRRDGLTFQSGNEVWVYPGQNLPARGGENVRMNLWLVGGRSPASGRPVEIVITSFDWHP